MCSSKNSNCQNENQAKVYSAEPTVWPDANFQSDDCTFYDDCDNVDTNYDDNGGNKSDCCFDGKSNVQPPPTPPQFGQFYDISSSTGEQCVNLNNVGSFMAPTTPCSSTVDCGAANQQHFQYGNCGGSSCTFASTSSMVTRHQISQQHSYHPYQRSSDLFTTDLSYQQPATVYPPLQHQQQQQIAQPPPQQFQRRHQPIYGGIPAQNQLPAQQRPHLMTAASPYYNQIQSNAYGGGGGGDNVGGLGLLSAPCRGNQPWTYAYCYGYAHNSQEPCQYAQFVDIEDFMNNEKRKEKSRDAARCRRSRETEIFTDLAQVLPLKQDDVHQLDKASIMRIAIAYLKVREMLQLFPNIQALNENDLKSDINSEASNDSLPSDSNVDSFDLLQCAEASQLMKQTLDGFLLVLSNDGDITYVSDNITEYLGLAKIDIMGQQIWEYSHQCDHVELKEALNIKRNGMADKVKDENMFEEGLSTDHRDLFVRLKCTLTSRGRSINIKSASYKVIHLTGHLVVNTKGDRVLVAIGRPIPHPTNIETPLGTTTFMTKHSLDMKFTYADEKMLDLLGYKSEDLIDNSLFKYHHGADTDSLMSTFKIVLGKGQGETCLYRFLGKYGGYCWIVTQATVVYDKLKPQSVVCVNYVISNLENDNEIYSLAQFEASQTKVKIEKISNNKNTTSENSNNNNNNCNKQNTLNVVEQQQPVNIKTTTNNINSTNNTPTKTPINQQNIETLINDNNNNNKDSNCDVEINRPIKTERTTIKPPIVATISTGNASTTTLSPSPPTTTTATATTRVTATNNIDNNIITTTTSLIKRIQLEKQQQQQPQQQTPTTTVTQKLLTENKGYSTFKSSSTSSTPPPSSSSSSSSSYKSLSSSARPKSVTASVFRAAPGILPNILTFNSNKNNNNNNNNKFNNNSTTDYNNKAIINNTPTTAAPNFASSLQLPTHVSSRAQSVTASVFTPIANSQIQKSQSQQQLHINKATTTTTTSTAAILAGQQQQPQPQPQPQQQSLQLQQQDMNKGFLTFAEDATNELTMLKEEPDDLAHLAPSTTVVDACMPLDETTPLFGEILGLMGSYGSLLPDDINSLDSTTSSSASEAALTGRTTAASLSSPVTISSSTSSSTSSSSSASLSTSSPPSNQTIAETVATKHNCNNSNNNNGSNNNNNNINYNNGNETTKTPEATNTTTSLNGNNSKVNAHIDPFINYREESNDTNCSQHLLSPSVTSTSPEASSLPSLCSPNSLSQEDEFAFMTMNVDDDIDLTMRAPYIPMNEQDDLPLLTADDLMWCSSNAFSTDDMQMPKDIADVMQQQFQQLQQIQAACDNSQLRGNIIDFTNAPSLQSSTSQQQHQQQHQHLNNHFPNSLCSSPASTVSSLSPSPVNSMQHNPQQDTNTTTAFGTDSSELAALLCGTGTGTLTILGNACNEDTDGLGGGSIDSNGGNTNQSSNNCSTNNNVDGRSGGDVINSDGIHFRHQLLLQTDDDLQQQQQQQQQQLQRHQQQQQQQHMLGGLSIICKKEKFDANALTPSLCDSIEDAFDNVYSKDSTNLDCWNVFLPMNVNEATTTNDSAAVVEATAQQLDLEFSNDGCKQSQQQQQQDLLLNAVPLITVQNNKNIILQQINGNANGTAGAATTSNVNNINKLIVNDEMLSSTVAATITTPNNRNCLGNNSKVTTIKLLNGTSPTTVRVIDGKLQQQHLQQQQHMLPRNQTPPTKTIIQTVIAPQQHGSKRHLNPNTMQFETKRLKSGTVAATIELQAAPQLLQQLIAPMQQHQHQQQQQQQLPLSSVKIEQQQIAKANQQQKKIANQRWCAAGNELKQQQQQQQQQQQSDSVLKNLLISGCDVSAGYCLVPMRPKKLAAKA